MATVKLGRGRVCHSRMRAAAACTPSLAVDVSCTGVWQGPEGDQRGTGARGRQRQREQTIIDILGHQRLFSQEQERSRLSCQGLRLIPYAPHFAVHGLAIDTAGSRRSAGELRRQRIERRDETRQGPHMLPAVRRQHLGHVIGCPCSFASDFHPALTRSFAVARVGVRGPSSSFRFLARTRVRGLLSARYLRLQGLPPKQPEPAALRVADTGGLVGLLIVSRRAVASPVCGVAAIPCVTALLMEAPPPISLPSTAGFWVLDWLWLTWSLTCLSSAHKARQSPRPLSWGTMAQLGVWAALTSPTPPRPRSTVPRISKPSGEALLALVGDNNAPTDSPCKPWPIPGKQAQAPEASDSTHTSENTVPA